MRGENARARRIGMIPPGGIDRNRAARAASTPDEVDWRSMDPRDRQPPFANGVDCAVCGRSVPVDGIRVLARREDLTFVELACAGCRSETLGIIVAGEAGQPDGAPYGEFLPADHVRFREALPIGADDVEAVRDVLARAGLDGLLDTPDEPAGGGRAT